MKLIRNISVLILFFGIIILTIYMTKSYNFKIEDSVIHKSKLDMEKKKLENELNKHYSKRPTKMFSKMFENSTPWMGYSDPDTIAKNITTYADFDSKKYSSVK